MVKLEFPSDSLSDYYRNWMNKYITGVQLNELFSVAMKLAYDNNTIVFDEEAKPDFLSKRLISLIQRTGRDKFFKKLNCVYVTQPVRFDSTFDNIQQEPGDTVTAIFGVPIVVAPCSLEMAYHQIDKVVNKLDYDFPHTITRGKANIALCVFDNNYILGTF